MNKEFGKNAFSRSQNRNRRTLHEAPERSASVARPSLGTPLDSQGFSEEKASSVPSGPRSSGKNSDDFFDSGADASRDQESQNEGSLSRAGSDSDETPVLSGLKPVLELLERDPSRVDMVLVRKGQRSKETDRILDLCRDHGVRFTLTDATGLERLCPRGHQGVAARLFDAGFTDWHVLLEQTVDAPLPLLVMLDQVQDPGNVGTLARTLYALGGAGLVIPRHNGAYLGSGARRAAAGALERLPVARVMNLSRALDEADAAGFQIYGAATEGASLNAFTAPLHTPAILVLGSEEHGIRPQIRKRCHQVVAIPMLRDFDSLNVAQAGGILIGCFSQRQAARQTGATTPNAVQGHEAS